MKNKGRNFKKQQKCEEKREKAGGGTAEKMLCEIYTKQTKAASRTGVFHKTLHGSPLNWGEISEEEKCLFCRRSAVIQNGQVGDVVGQQPGQRGGKTPLPVGPLGAGGVDAGLCAQM